MAGKVRHPIDTAALERYITENVPEIKLPLDIKQFGFGQSNPTYQLTSTVDGSRYVLRKKPAGALLSQAAHKVEREYRVIRALGQHNEQLAPPRRRHRVPVPRALCLCEDSAVLGTPFYVMTFVGGRIFEDPAMPDARGAAERTLLWKAAVEALAALHSVDPAAVGLESFGGGGGKKNNAQGGGGSRASFYERQLATWTQICEAQAQTRDAETGAAVGPIPHMAELLAFFGDASRRPRDRAALIHGDYKIDNLIFTAAADGQDPAVAAILDWEMSTIGHPLSDLANLMYPFFSAELSSSSASSTSASPSSSAPSVSISNPAFLASSRAALGIPEPATLLSWYVAAATSASSSGRGAPAKL
ncbi:phosphotransferase enzyme family protein [Durotheca rogersii]|uniref:phosphotransferase enzyme family protein n=1 Tax=Durotheca rogersii TaxID=419775 RepID=UPI002220E6B7|nr:phosphotransferase enzyme family protein [Durotheca rogersii]KAI5868667.1 phosphotransferase enzyme family protein [Durotheca rogersii]